MKKSVLPLGCVLTLGAGSRILGTGGSLDLAPANFPANLDIGRFCDLHVCPSRKAKIKPLKIPSGEQRLNGMRKIFFQKN